MAERPTARRPPHHRPLPRQRAIQGRLARSHRSGGRYEDRHAPGAAPPNRLHPDDSRFRRVVARVGRPRERHIQFRRGGACGC